ncbi:MAG TPA: PTS sugar transporter subunit IIA [Kiritimatiellia bacterium]|nr:PTS sugar transporter subunit IIA [Kiritimatiellia bacterium]HPS08952.1 PTS sugar transporter subunit IIA [Kiritimatiellia bacterium]
MQLSVKDAATFLNVSDETIYKWVRQNEIPSHTVNEQIRFNRAELLEWATARNVHVSPDLFNAGEACKSSLPTLAEALKAGGVAYRVGGEDQPSVLRAIVDLLKLPETVDREFLYQILLARESLGSTGVGDGVAIPHVRNPLVLHVSEPVVTLSFLETPINFHAVDGKPVNTLFTLICPTVKIHLHLLSRLGFVLHNPSFKAALKKQVSCDELMSELAAAEAMIQG